MNIELVMIAIFMIGFGLGGITEILYQRYYHIKYEEDEVVIA